MLKMGRGPKHDWKLSSMAVSPARFGRKGTSRASEEEGVDFCRFRRSASRGKDKLMLQWLLMRFPTWSLKEAHLNISTTQLIPASLVALSHPSSDHGA